MLAGVATPLGLVDYILDEENPLNHGVLWSVYDLGYLAIETAVAIAKGEFDPANDSSFESSMGTKEVITGESGGREILMGKALIFDKDNVSEFNF